MKNAIKGTILIMIVAMVLFTGCAKKIVTTDPIVVDNMTDNIVDTQNDTVVVVDPVVIVDDNTTIANDTIDDSLENTTIVINDTVTDDNSVYSDYRDTGLIDESMDDLQSLN